MEKKEERKFEITSYELLGEEVHPLSIHELNELIGLAINNNRKIIICSQNLHSIYTLKKNKEMQGLHINSYKRIDGMPLILWGKFLGYPLKREHRVTWVDWMRPLMAEAELKKWSIFYIGSTKEVAEKAAQELRCCYPNLVINVSDGYFDMSTRSSENRKKINEMKKMKPNILMVGMGMPRQEEWVMKNKQNLDANVILTCGAAMEYFAGVVNSPPRWMGKLSLEWAYRLLDKPDRFWKRYLIEPWSLVPLMIADMKNKRWRQKAERQKR